MKARECTAPRAETLVTAMGFPQRACIHSFMMITLERAPEAKSRAKCKVQTKSNSAENRTRGKERKEEKRKDDSEDPGEERRIEGEVVMHHSYSYLQLSTAIYSYLSRGIHASHSR